MKTLTWEDRSAGKAATAVFMESPVRTGKLYRPGLPQARVASMPGACEAARALCDRRLASRRSALICRKILKYRLFLALAPGRPAAYPSSERCSERGAKARPRVHSGRMGIG